MTTFGWWFISALAGVIGGLLGNLVAAVIEQSVGGTFTVVQAVGMVGGILLALLVIYWVDEKRLKRPKKTRISELTRQLADLRASLRELDARAQSGVPVLDRDVEAWLQIQRYIRDVKYELHTLGERPHFDPIDEYPPHPTTKSRAEKLRVRLLQIIAWLPGLLFLSSVVLVSIAGTYYLSPYVHYGYLTTVDSSVPVIAPTPTPGGTPIAEATDEPTTTPTHTPSPGVSSGLVEATALAQTSEAISLESQQAALQLTLPLSGTMPHEVDNQLLEDFRTGVTVSDFIAEARFYNPYGIDEGGWDYGFIFRLRVVGDSATCVCYRLHVRSTGRWDLVFVPSVDPETEFEVIATGNVENLNTNSNGFNDFRLVVRGEEANLFINGNFVSTLDVSKRLDKGGVSIATGFMRGDEIDGKETRFEDFTIWSLDEEE